MKQLKSLALIIISLCLCLSVYSRSLEPNKQKIDTMVSVIDTVPAMEAFLLIKPTVQNNIDELRNKQSVLRSLLQSGQKKAKTDLEKSIVQDAFNYVIHNTRYYEYDLFGDRNAQDSKDVQKGKLTDAIKSFLSHYNENYLNPEITRLSNSLENDWTSFLNNPPTKMVTIQVDNHNYRGLHYNDYYDLNRIEEGRLIKGYEFLLSEKGERVTESYPREISYIKYQSLPNRRVKDLTFDKHRFEIYDNNGRLVYIPIIQRLSNMDVYPNFITKEIRRLIYYKDYQNNKYNIQSESPKTQRYLSLWIGRSQGLSKSEQELNELDNEGLFRGLGDLFGTNATAANEARCRQILAQKEPYKDDAGERFLKQLESDHSEDFGYIYAIERISDTKFLIVYLNKRTLLPSVCGIVTFFTGSEPYTTDFSVKLCQIPNDVPPVITKRNR